MFGTSRPPSAQELQELIELTRRDPGSPAFVDLGEAYIALGRPQDAAEVGARGLQANPGSIDGRMMMSRALVQLHDWKQAQAELLKIVKSDRNHAPGFLLLGEVLMRRGDFERAMPVLLHAQNLAPANPLVHELLRRARVGQPPDPPPPVPMAGHSPFDLPPTSPAQNFGPVAGNPFAGPGPGMVGGPPPPMPGPGMMAGGPSPGLAGPQPLAVAAPAAPTVAVSASPPTGGMPPASAPAPAVELQPGGVRPRPRVLPAEKPRDAAQASLRQSAAVGENYLNNLLTAGLLDLPNVRAPEAEFEIALGKRWGRSTRRAFVFLFTLLFLGIGGGGGWYYMAEKQRAQDVARHLAEADSLIQSATYSDLEAAVAETQRALERDPGNIRAMAVYAKAASLSALLYGKDADPVELALGLARKAVGEGSDGWRDLVLARAALTLATLPRVDEAKARLKDVRQSLEAWLEKSADDGLARWLLGMSLQAGGEYDAALAAFEAAGADGEGPVVAAISAGDVLLDRGEYEPAQARYDDALERAPAHPLALMGRVFLHIATGVEPGQIRGDINVHFGGKDHGPRLAAYRALALAMSSYLIEDYPRFAEELGKAQELAVAEPHYLARLGQAHVLAGRFKEATDARGRIGWYGDKDPEPPLVVITLLEAELLLTYGVPGATLAKLEGIKGLRATRLRGRAYYDQGKAAQAVTELDEALQIAPDDLEALLWREAARLARGSSKKERAEADSELDKLGRNSPNKMVRAVHGDALLRVGNKEEARRKLGDSLRDIADEYPNPLAYRSHVALAMLDMDEGQTAAAAEQLDKVFAQVSAYVPAKVLLGRILLGRGQFDEAYEALKVVVDEPEAATAVVELAFAEAAVSRRGTISSEEREAARQAVRRARGKGAAAEELARVAGLVDPALLEELSIAVEASRPKKKAPPPKKKRR